MSPEKTDSINREGGAPVAGVDSLTEKCIRETTGRGGELKCWVMAIWYLATWPLVQLPIVPRRLKTAHCQGQAAWSVALARLHGIDPDTFPEMAKVKRQNVELEQLKEEWKLLKAEVREKRRRERAELLEESKQETELWLKKWWPKRFR